MSAEINQLKTISQEFNEILKSSAIKDRIKDVQLTNVLEQIEKLSYESTPEEKEATIKKLLTDADVIAADSNENVELLIAVREKAKNIINSIAPDSNENVERILRLKELIK